MQRSLHSHYIYNNNFVKVPISNLCLKLGRPISYTGNIGRAGSVMEVHHTYYKSLKVTLKAGPNPNPSFSLFFYFLVPVFSIIIARQHTAADARY